MRAIDHSTIVVQCVARVAFTGLKTTNDAGCGDDARTCSGVWRRWRKRLYQAVAKGLVTAYAATTADRLQAPVSGVSKLCMISAVHAPRACEERKLVVSIALTVVAS